MHHYCNIVLTLPLLCLFHLVSFLSCRIICATTNSVMVQFPKTNKSTIRHTKKICYYFLILAVPTSRTPSAAALHVHLIRPTNPLLCFCCCLYGPFSLCGWFTAQKSVFKSHLEIWGQGRNLVLYPGYSACEGLTSTVRWLTRHHCLILDVIGSLGCDRGLKCQWVFNLVVWLHKVTSW